MIRQPRRAAELIQALDTTVIVVSYPPSHPLVIERARRYGHVPHRRAWGLKYKRGRATFGIAGWTTYLFGTWSQACRAAAFVEARGGMPEQWEAAERVEQKRAAERQRRGRQRRRRAGAE